MLNQFKHSFKIVKTDSDSFYARLHTLKLNADKTVISAVFKNGKALQNGDVTLTDYCTFQVISATAFKETVTGIESVTVFNDEILDMYVLCKRRKATDCGT